MTNIDRQGNIHSAAGAPGGGRFAGRINSSPDRGLDPTSWPVDGDSTDVTGLRETLADQLAVDADLQRAVDAMENQGIDFRAYSPAPEQIARIVKEAILTERWRDTPTPGSLSEHAIGDVPTMGGDEIRAMTPAQRRHLLSQAVQAASRLQDYMRELDEDPDERTEHLEVLDFRALTEKNLSDVWIAARDQLGARGILRTEIDFYERALDLDPEAILGVGRVLSDEDIKRGWQHYLQHQAAEYEDRTAGELEYQRFSGHVEEALRATR